MLQANKRIDAGIKRGPRPSKAVAILQREQIIGQLAQGSMVKDVAASLGVSGEAISQQLANDPEYKAAREKGIALRLEEHYSEIKGAKDALSLARGREAWRAATWFAEREFPARWGQHQQMTVTSTFNVNVDLIESARDLLEHVAERQVQDVQDSEPIELEVLHEPDNTELDIPVFLDVSKA